MNCELKKFLVFFLSAKQIVIKKKTGAYFFANIPSSFDFIFFIFCCTIKFMIYYSCLIIK